MKLTSPATARNRDPITAVLKEVLPERGLVLEVASGAGEHAVHFARQFQDLVWQPSDPSADALASIEAHAGDADLPNLRGPVMLDAAADTWPIEWADAIVCINMVHISPWAATQGLMRGGGRLIGAGGPLILYGPYRRAGVETAPSNQAFDQSLKDRNPGWGLRNLEDVAGEAERNGLSLERVVEMPANNLIAVFRKT